MRTAFFILALAPTLAFAQNANNPDCANAYPIAVSSGGVPDEWVLSNTGDEPNAHQPGGVRATATVMWFSFVATASTLTLCTMAVQWMPCASRRSAGHAVRSTASAARQGRSPIVLCP
ncbi:MAG: hypothetical protein IPG74_14705 [Flavobacteriales bacterium]|nr:hypothetical protein [Flavobacteriales bacterium]